MFPSNYLIDKNGKIAVFPLSFWKDSAGKIKMTMFQSTFLYSTLVKYLGEPKNAAEAFAQSKGTVFSVVQENAKSVAIAGSFNRWGAKPMFKVNGKWACKVDLAPGTYQYKYIVDGTWIVDPANTNIVDDGFGNKNSQIVIK
jgi:1,4-alpha-glucan branching enzyme